LKISSKMILNCRERRFKEIIPYEEGISKSYRKSKIISLNLLYTRIRSKRCQRI